MVMEETERNLREKIEQEAKNTLKKNMWEGYANDILTGLQKNPGVQPDRPIWELVQNARDVAYENKKTKIVFIRKQDHSYFNIMVNRYSYNITIAYFTDKFESSRRYHTSWAIWNRFPYYP